jgi:hypothetical protein
MEAIRLQDIPSVAIGLHPMLVMSRADESRSSARRAMNTDERSTDSRMSQLNHYHEEVGACIPDIAPKSSSAACSVLQIDLHIASASVR